MRRHSLLLLTFCALAGAGLAAAQSGAGEEGKALALAKRQADEAMRRSQQLEKKATQATDDAARARADASALAARIEAAEADITASETRLRIIEARRAEQRARLAERQEPVVRLTAALQTMARRPPALALVQPGSLHDLVHVRALLASTLPVIRQRTAALREEVAAGNRLRLQAEQGMAALVTSREELKTRRVQLARLEAEQRQRSEILSASALVESDRALALGEEARDISARVGTLQYQSRLRQSLASLPGPTLRPSIPGSAAATDAARGRSPRYQLPVQGRVITGMGEISDAGVHARGLTFETQPDSPVVAPAPGRVVYAGRFRTYGEIVIIDHGRGWISTITSLASLQVRSGEQIRRGTMLGRTARNQPRVTVELRRDGLPFPIAPLLSLA